MKGIEGNSVSPFPGGEPAFLRFRAPSSWRVVALALVIGLLLLAEQASAAFERPLTRNGTCVETDGIVFQPKVLADLPGGGKRIRYRCGPIAVTPGQNRIEWPMMLRGLHRPDENGYITRLKPDLVTRGGRPLRSDHVMFHHAVWLNMTRPDATTGRNPDRFFGAGEEKTTLALPPGHGYRYVASDTWLLNHMLHSLVARPYQLYIQYTIDFYPDGSAGASDMTQVRSVWMDVDNGSAYPVFNACRGQGGADGRFTFPDDLLGRPATDDGPADCPRSYPNPLNRWTVDRDGYLVWTAGHVHSGGLWTDLNLIREGAQNEVEGCRAAFSDLARIRREVASLDRRISRARKREASRAVLLRLRKLRMDKMPSLTAAEAEWDSCPRVNGNKVRLFRSNAKYFERDGRKIGPISWDMAMFNTTRNWRPQLEAGDTLEVTTTYETRRASWYESMGINFVFMADCNAEDPGRQCGENPYRERQDGRRELNHGPLPENDYHFGRRALYPNPAKVKARRVRGSLLIGNWTYTKTDFRLGKVAAVRRGEKVEFEMAGSNETRELWHSITSCKAPCNRETGISYPIPDGRFRFDSGQLGTGNQGPLPSAGTTGELSWSLPTRRLKPGTYPFFCRIHPSMRGAIKVLPRN